MQVKAFILVQTEVGQAAKVAEQIRLIPGIESAEDVIGPYDVIAVATAGDVDELGRMIVSKVQMLDGLTRTLTCQVVHL